MLWIKLIKKKIKNCKYSSPKLVHVQHARIYHGLHYVYTRPFCSARACLSRTYIMLLRSRVNECVRERVWTSVCVWNTYFFGSIKLHLPLLQNVLSYAPYTLYNLLIWNTFSVATRAQSILNSEKYPYIYSVHEDYWIIHKLSCIRKAIIFYLCAYIYIEYSGLQASAGNCHSGNLYGEKFIFCMKTHFLLDVLRRYT